MLYCRGLANVVEIKETKERGRFAVAKENINPGKYILYKVDFWTFIRRINSSKGLGLYHLECCLGIFNPVYVQGVLEYLTLYMIRASWNIYPRYVQGVLEYLSLYMYRVS